jgi:lipid-A-disaccharide synthase
MIVGTRPRTVAIVAGEPSGDMLAAQLVQAVGKLAPGVRFVGVGGNRMQAAGVECLYPVERLAVRGYVEVLRHFFDIVGIRRELRRRWLSSPPDLFVGVDAPDFNFALEHALRHAGIPTVHYISPSIWAWRPERMTKIKAAVSHMLALFPFEAPIYEAAGVPVTFVGHPLADMLPLQPDRLQAREQLRLPADRTVVALLPGSRASELNHHADVYVATLKLVSQRRPDVIFLAPMVNRTTRGLFEEALARSGAMPENLTLLFGHSHEALMAADAALVASGTATLEAALLGCPMVITYRMPALSWRIMWPKRRLPYVGLPNVLAGEFVVPELLQDDATPENLAQALLNLLEDSLVRRRIEARFSRMRAGLRRNAADTAAEVVVRLLGAAA